MGAVVIGGLLSIVAAVIGGRIANDGLAVQTTRQVRMTSYEAFLRADESYVQAQTKAARNLSSECLRKAEKGITDGNCKLSPEDARAVTEAELATKAAFKGLLLTASPETIEAAAHLLNVQGHGVLGEDPTQSTVGSYIAEIVLKARGDKVEVSNEEAIKMLSEMTCDISQRVYSTKFSLNSQKVEIVGKKCALES